MTPLISSLRAFRTALRMSQLELARRAGISRQALGAIEGGTSIPGTDVALRLAKAVGARVDELFHLEEAAPEIGGTLASGAELPGAEGKARVVLAEVQGKWIAHPIDNRDPGALAQAADGLAARGCDARRARTVRVEALGDIEAARTRLVVLGCAPALGLVAARLADQPGEVRLSWVHGTSAAALEALRNREVHVAGLHLFDERSGEYNAPVVRSRVRDRGMLLVNLVSWEQGIVVAAGNPLRIRGAADLLRRGVRFVAREPGAGAHQLLERALRGEGAPGMSRKAALTARGHMEVAGAVALGAADAGVAIRAAAMAHGLDFVPLAEERFDLVIPRELATDPRIERLVDTIGSRSFRRELDHAGGYLTQLSGRQVGETRAR